MKKAVIVLLVAILGGSLQAYSQDQPAPPKGKISGVMFGDYFYNIDNHDASKKDLNGFQFRRIYFTYDYALSNEFDTRFRIEADQNALTSNGRFSLFMKDAYIKWKKVVFNSDLTFGLAPIPGIEILEDAWGYRALEKTIMDLNGIISTRDLGLDMRGNLSESGSTDYMLKIGNNSGLSNEANKFKRFYGHVHLKSADGFNAMLYADYAAEPQIRNFATGQDVGHSSVTFDALLNYHVTDTYSIGLEGVYRSWQNDQVAPSGSLENRNSAGISAYAWYGLSNNYRLIGRVDLFDPNSSIDDDGTTLILAGFDYIANDDVHIIPNFELLKYHAANVDSDVAARLTVSYNYH